MATRHRLTPSFVLLAAVALAQASGSVALAQERLTLSVPGSSNPYLSGAPDGTPAGNDQAPQQSPVLLPNLRGGTTVLVFEVSGGASYTGGFFRFEPDGGDPWEHTAGDRNGMSAVTAPAASLLGVFLAEDVFPEAPPGLDFTDPATRDFTELAPDLQQVFFIGDGRTAEGAVQEFLAPKGATRLYLGIMDAYGWYDNTGAYEVTVTLSPPR